MKKHFLPSLLLLILALTVSVTVACQSGDSNNAVTDGESTVSGSETVGETTVPEDSQGIRSWLTYGGNLTVRDKYTVETRESIAISMAKNEMEGFQYVMVPDQNYDDLRVEVSTLTDGQGHSLDGIVHVAWDMWVNQPSGINARGFTPYALLPQDDPFQGGTFDLVKDRAKTIYVLYQTDANSAPGTYTGTLTLKQGDSVLKTHDISVTVWNIYYDEATECLTSIGYGFSWDSWEPEAPPSAPDMLKEPIELCYRYVDFLLRYRLCPSLLPDATISDEKAAQYLNNPRMTTFTVPFATLYDLKNNDQMDVLAEWYEVAEANGWTHKINLCLGDEPLDPDAIDRDIEMGRLCQQYFNTTWFGVPTYVPLDKDGKNLIERYAEITTLHIPKKKLLVDQPELLTSAQKLKAERGDTLMWYVAGDEAWNMINVLPCEAGTLQRIMFWQQYQNDFDGFLIWQTNMWEGFPDIWAEGYGDMKQGGPKYKNTDGNGCAILWNPITKEPLSTLSVEALRDGIEDFQLMRMAEAVLGKDTVMQMVEEITTSITEYTKDAELLNQVKCELANALLAAQAQ